MKSKVMGLVMAGALLAVPGVVQAKEEEIAAAQEWLALVDAGKYDESWDMAAAYFQGAVSKEQWKASLGAVRAPLGAVTSRTMASGNFHTQLPGAPDGKYFVIQYNTSFERKQQAVETVTPMQQPDGSWKVSGYYIK
jgi:hypothetical protein